MEKQTRAVHTSGLRFVRMLTVLLCGGISCFWYSTIAQISQTHRYEREHKGGDETYTLISLKKEGLALVREKDKYHGSKRTWELVLLDTTLTEKKIIEFEIEQRHHFIGYEIAPHHLYLLYRTGETTKNSLFLINLDLAEGTEVSRDEIKPELDFKITHFSKVGSSLVLGGYVSSDPAILLYDMTSKNIKVVPGFFQKDNELVDLRVNQNQTFNTVIIDRGIKSERKLVFKTFDESGKLLLEDIIPIAEDRSLQTTISSTLEREDLILLGTWGDKQSKQSIGFFSLNVDPFREQTIKYYHFGELQHYLDYLNPKRAERIKANTAKDLENSHKPSFTSYVMPYRIEEREDGFLLLAEVYNPVTSMNPYYNSPYGSPGYGNPYYYNPYWPGYYPGMRMYRPYSYGNNVKNADEIRTYSTTVISFDSNGNRKWDYSIKLDDIERQSLEQVADYYINTTNLFFLYKKESELKIKSITLEEDTVTETSEKIKLNDSVDDVRDERESEGGIRHWLGNSFYVWGYQTIKNVNRNDRVRDVFYVNKIEVK
jgi:hypothetical protein